MLCEFQLGDGHEGKLSIRMHCFFHTSPLNLLLASWTTLDEQSRYKPRTFQSPKLTLARVMLLSLPPPLIRPLLIILLLIPIVLVILRIGQDPGLAHVLPNGVLLDYTKPSTPCFWPGLRDSLPSSSFTSKTEWSDLYRSLQIQHDHGNHESLGNSFDKEVQLLDVVPVSGIERYIQSYLEELQEPYVPEHDLTEYGLKLGNISLAAYTAELLSTYHTYLQPVTPSASPPSYLPPLLSRLSLRPPIALLPDRPNQILTTDRSINHVPWEFGRWKEIMPDWEIKYFDDASLESWVRGVFRGTRAEGIWIELPRAVLQTDVFRWVV